MSVLSLASVLLLSPSPPRARTGRWHITVELPRLGIQFVLILYIYLVYTKIRENRQLFIPVATTIKPPSPLPPPPPITPPLEDLHQDRQGPPLPNRMTSIDMASQRSRPISITPPPVGTRNTRHAWHTIQHNFGNEEGEHNGQNRDNPLYQPM